ncbi:tyrosine-type recombinase/integrase [Nioella sp.]|uniref:tyrosine-type recombinase/integrase n=1 Tax=Nioella sp. TaxID=1912091 RepID=UPI003A859FA2
MPKYLQKRRRRWYAVLDIPKALRPALGGHARFVESLKTESLTEAERKVPQVIGQWKALIEAVRRGDPAPLVDHQATALAWREQLDSITDEEERDGVESVMVELAKEHERTNPGQGVEMFKVATRQWERTDELLEDWLATLDNEAKTVDMKRSDVLRFSQRFRQTKDVNRQAVLSWVDHLLQQDGLAPATVRRIVSACRGYWEFLQRRGLAAGKSDPFHKVVRPASRKKSKAQIAAMRKPFTPEQVDLLLEAAATKGDTPLHHLIWLAMWTGCRIEELCGLRLNHVKDDRLLIEDAKSEAGWREVPIHSKLLLLVRELSTSSRDGYLLSGLTSNKYGDRSNAVGKRFGHLKKAQGFGPDYVFHSIRKTVATQLEAAGVQESVSARILGHEVPTMTYGLYSGGVPFEVKQEALESLSYPCLRGWPAILHETIYPA